MTHEHQFGEPKFRVVQMCAVEGCVEMRIGTKRGRFRDLTTDERIAVTARQIEDIALVQAMQIIHGPDYGLQRVREIRGYRSVPDRGGE